MNYPPVKVGLLGLGTVGGGVTRVLARNAGEISRRAGARDRDYSCRCPQSGLHHGQHPPG
jgi:homoserine dehydrogenase